jgi:hypothetical protein
LKSVWSGCLHAVCSRWSTSESEELQRLAAQLREQGHDVSYVEPDEEGDGPAVRFRRRDERAVLRIIDRG